MAKKKGTSEKASDRRQGGIEPQPIPSIPRWVPVAAYAAIAVFLFRAFIFSDEMLFGSDTVVGMGYVVRDLYAQALHSLGRIPGWAPHILGGMPFLESLSAGDSLYPPSLLLLLISAPHRALGWKLVLHIFLAGLFFFGWVRAIGGTRAAAFLGGAAYMLAPFMVSFVQPGHDGKIFVTALTPLLFWATERHFAKPSLGSIGGIGLLVALILYTTHFQMAYFLFGGVGLFGMFRSFQIARGADDLGKAPGSELPGEAGTSRRKAGAMRFVLFLVAAVLGATGAAYQFFPAVDYVTTYSRRIQTTDETAGRSGKTWSSSYSMNPEEAMSLIVPEFAGNMAGGNAWTTGTYWGRNGLKDNHEYAGLVVLLLAAVSFFGGARRHLRFFFVGLGLLSFTFALGANTPEWGILYALLPGISLFRAPGMAIFLFGFGTITLASLGVDRILQVTAAGDNHELARIQKVLWVGAGSVTVVAFLIASGVFTTVWTTMVYSSIGQRQLQVLSAHLPNIVLGASIAALLAGATAGAVWALRSGRVPVRVAFAILVALVVVDEARVDAPFIGTMDYYGWSQPDPNIQVMLEREEGGEPYRLWSLSRSSQDVNPAMHGVELAAGNHPNNLSRYHELIGMVGTSAPANLGNLNIRKILNVRYILWPDNERGPAPQGTVVSRTEYSDGRTYNTLLADGGLPRARLVGSAVVKNDTNAIPYMLSKDHDPSLEVVLVEEPGVELSGGAVEGSVVWAQRDADVHRLEVVSDQPALLIVADNWFPAWRATVNGENTEVLRAYHSLRAVPVPAGTSTVEMWYESKILDRSLILSLIVMTTLFGAWAFSLWQVRVHNVPATSSEPTSAGAPS
jgi:hypothetical protein